MLKISLESFNLQKSPEVDIIIDIVKELKPENVLEVGCNFARELKYIENLTQIYGIDKNKEKIEAAKNFANGTFKVGCASLLPYKDNSFDLVYSSGVFSHNPPEEIKKYINEMYRASKKYILLVEYVGSRLSKNVVGNCKKNTWVHDYEMLTFPLNVYVKYNKQKFFGTDLFHVLLLEKFSEKSINKYNIKERENLKKVFSFKLGKLKMEISYAKT